MYSESISNFSPIPLYNVAGAPVGQLFTGAQNQPLLSLNGGLQGVSVALQHRLSYQYKTDIYEGTTRIGSAKFNQWGQLILFS